MSDKLYTYQEAFVPSLRRVEGFDIPIPMPEMPPFEEMENYYLPKDEQVFRTTVIPKNLRSLEKAREREIVSREWHKRLNGVWMFIDGEPIYIPGRAYTFFNYWITEAGTLPDFRWEALEFFWVWDYVWRSKVDYGLLIVKCRRLGDSEKSKFLLWETATRYRKAWCGMQHMKEDDAKDSFSDIVTANQQMVYFFKPVSNGNDDPKGALEFKYPTAREGLNSLKAKQRSGNKEVEAGVPALNSKINYETTKLKRYDGKRLTLYHMDEYGKMEIMNAVKQWGIIKPALSLHGGTVIVGKAIFTSTVEELGTGECLENAKELWETSNPADRNAQGSTTSGLLRYFRTAKLAATVDKFGKHQSEKVVQMVNDTVKDLMKNGRHDRVSEYKRKMPLNIEDVFITRAEDCDLLPYKLDERLQQIEMGIGWDGAPERINIKRVSLIWRNGHFGTDVISVPDESGRWYMSQEPTYLNASDWDYGARRPGNTGAYSSGADPIDHRTTNGRGSKGSFTVYRKYDRAVDGHLGIKGDDGIIRFPDSAMSKMLTDQFVCSYTYRPDNPVEFYEDYLKTLIYYGCQGLIEMNKPGLANWLIEKGYRGYVQTRPSNTKKNPHQRIKGEDLGASATEEVIGHYINALKDHIARRIGSCKHAEIIKDWRQFQYSNRTIRDLSVASGFNLLGAADPRYISTEEEVKEEWVAPWQPKAAIF